MCEWLLQPPLSFSVYSWDLLQRVPILEGSPTPSSCSLQLRDLCTLLSLVHGGPLWFWASHLSSSVALLHPTAASAMALTPQATQTVPFVCATCKSVPLAQFPAVTGRALNPLSWHLQHPGLRPGLIVPVFQTSPVAAICMRLCP